MGKSIIQLIYHLVLNHEILSGITPRVRPLPMPLQPQFPPQPKRQAKANPKVTPHQIVANQWTFPESLHLAAKDPHFQIVKTIV